MAEARNEFCVEENTGIWRYMSFASFVSLLQTRRLYFQRADRLIDIYEGKIPELFFYSWPKEAVDFYLSIHDTCKQHTYVNCWCMGDNESYAMWQIYGGKNHGVAIHTTVGNLRKSIIENGLNMDIKKVKYMDFGKLINDGMFYDRHKELLRDNFYACKSMEYEYEKEIRIILYDREKPAVKKVNVDVSTLIGDIYVNPFAGGWFGEVVSLTLQQYGLSDKNVIHSKIKLNKNK